MIDFWQVVLASGLLGVLVCAGVWDIVAVACLKPESTISAILQSWSRIYPILPFLIGVLIGHLFWPL